MTEDEKLARSMVDSYYGRRGSGYHPSGEKGYRDAMFAALRDNGLLPSQRPNPSDEAMIEILHALEMDDLDGYPDACARIRALFEVKQ